MVSLSRLPSPRAGATLLGLAALAFAGCEGTTGAYTDPYGTPVSATGQPAYPNQYPNGYPSQYPNQYPAQYPQQPAYSGQPIYSADAMAQPVYPSASTVYAPGAVDAPDDYIYYPDAEVYYSPSRNEYAYSNGGTWVWRREPPRDWHRNEASVHVRISGGPERHHDEIRRMYPRNYDRHDRDRDGDRDWNRR